MKELSDDCLEIRSIDEEVLGYGIGDHITIHPAASTTTTITITSSTPSSGMGNSLSMEFIVKEVINMQTCVIQPVLPHEGDKQGIITLIASNNAIAQKLKSQRTVHHAPFDMQLLNPSFTPGNGCLSPKQDHATNLILLALLKVDFLLSNSKLSSADYERQLNASLHMELQLLTNNSDIFTPRKRKNGKMGVNIIQTVFTSFLLSLQPNSAQNSAQMREIKQCPALVSVLGAIGAQEVIKGLTQLYLPVDQFLMVEGLDTIHPVPLSPTAAVSSSTAKEEVEEGGDQQQLQQSKQQQQQTQFIEQELAGLKVFIVGAGAIGCELLKTFALLGVGTGGKTRLLSSAQTRSLWQQHGLENGGIIVTDNDHIERSNLNRQLLFRPKHIGLAKSTIAAEQVKKINPNVNILALTSRVGRTEGDKGESELFDESFWQEIDIVVTALDNVEARLFIDEQCIKHKLWLIDSGTLGTKGNTQVIIPYLSESYGSSADPPEVQLPLCTVKSFPYQPEHCVAWAKELFATAFGTDISNLEQSLTDSVTNSNNELTEEDQQRLQDNLATLDQPITWAKKLFIKLFQQDVEVLLKQHPKDSVDEDDASTPFWSGSRRLPSVINYDEKDDLHVEFVASAVYVKLRALNQLPESWTLDTIKDKIRNNEDIMLYKLGLKGEKIQLLPQTFEKDEMSLGHVHFVTSAANLRSRVYNLKEVDLLTAQGLAGKIIPALATTTALVSGLVSLEVIKVASERILLRSGQNHGYYQDVKANSTANSENASDKDKVRSSIGRWILNQLLRKKKPEPNLSHSHRLSHTHPMQRLQLDEERLLKRFRNSFVNLAVPLLSFAQPVSADTLSLHTQTNQKFNLWHEINLDLSSVDAMTVEELLQMLKAEYEVEVTAMMADESMVYASFLPEAEEIRQKTVRQLLEPLLPRSALASDEDSEDDDEDAEEEDKVATRHLAQVVRLELSCHKASSEAISDEAGDEGEDEAEVTDVEEVRLPPLVIRIQPSLQTIAADDEEGEEDEESDEKDNNNKKGSLFRRGWLKIKEATKLIIEK